MLRLIKILCGRLWVRERPDALPGDDNPVVVYVWGHRLRVVRVAVGVAVGLAIGLVPATYMLAL